MVTVAEAIDAGRKAIRQREPEIVDQMLRAYDTAWTGVERELAIIERRIEDAIEAGVEVKPSWLRRQAWYQRMQASIEVEMGRFQDQALRTLHAAQTEAVALSAETAGLVAQAAGVEAGIVARVNPGAMERWVSALQPDSPLRGVLERYGPRVEQIIIDRMTEGLGGGKGVRSIVNDIRRDAGPDGVQGRLHTLTRTETLRAYRGANRDDFERIGSDVINAWEWLADKGTRTCLACLAYDGRRFPYREYPSRFHPACRCVIRPVVDPSLVPPTRPRETGAEWLARQPEDVQRQIIGTEGRWELYRQGVPISEFVGVKKSRTWGDSLFVKPAGAVSVPTPPQAEAEALAEKIFADLFGGQTHSGFSPPPSSFRSPDEARSYFDSLGVSVGEFKGNKKVWREVADIYQRELEAGYEVPKLLTFSSSRKGKQVAAYNKVTDATTGKLEREWLEVNTASPYWTKRDQVAPKMADWLVGTEPDDVIRHELGHWYHDRRITTSRWGGEFTYNGKTFNVNSPAAAYDYAAAQQERELFSRVSRYPAEARSNNRLEFVAEVYTGLRKGITYDDEVMAFYRALGGPNV